MPLIDDADVQTHLPIDRLKVESIPDDLAKCKLDAQRIIRGALAGVVSTAVLNTWDEPENTPEVIRAIAGRLCASLIFRVRIAQNFRDMASYGQALYNEAMAMLNQIIAGDLLIPDVVIGTDFTNAWFEPNNASDPPKFTMADRY